MKTLYLKYSGFRRKEFALTTKICVDKGKKVVIKEPCFPEGIPHLKRIVESQRLFAKYYKNVKISKTWIKDNNLYAEFIDGIQLSDHYINAIKNNDKQKISELLKYHLELMLGKNNTCTFFMTDKFKEIFGETDIFEGEPALIFTFFEADPGNIISLHGKNDKPYFIDYEWTFDFPIPISLLKFRIIQQLSYLAGMDEVVSFDERLKILDCRIPFYSGIVFIVNFSEYVYKKNNINYLAVDKNYEKNIIKYPDPVVYYYKLFINTGNGYTEDNKLFHSFSGNEVEISCQIPGNTISIRLDPIEDYGCVVSNLEILSYGGIVNYEPVNGYKDKNNAMIFTNTDPQIELHGAAHWIKIKYRILPISDFSHYMVFDNFIEIDQQRNNLIAEQNKLITEQNRLIVEYNNLAAERDNLAFKHDELLAERNNLITKYPELTVQNYTLYINTGNGYSEDEKIVHSFSGNEIEISCQIPENTISVRLDPIENHGCIVSNLEILSFSGIVNYEPINGYKNNNGDLVFVNIDPQVELYGAAYWIKIKYRITSLSDFSYYKVFNNFIEISQQRDNLVIERNNLMIERDKLTVERNSLTVERNSLTVERDGLLNSRSWRITKPLRKFTAFIRKFKVLRFFAKGLMSIKRNGIIATIKKIKTYKKRKLQDIVSLIDINALLTQPERLSQENTVFPKKIKISIITPLYNTPEQFLNEMIQSVKDQSYSNWELCLADGSDDKHKNIKRICKDLVKNDKRIKYKKLKKNFGISGNSNKALEMSCGEYIGLLDHDDVLHPSALFEVMKAICYENADFIYTDETTFINRLDNIVWKHHKPDFAIDTLRSCNYICHFSVFSRKLMKQAGTFRSEFDGSQDYDLILRYTDIASKIYHIPKVLYFWRNHENSVAYDINNKEYAVLAAKKAIEEHLTKHGITAQIESTKVYSSFYRIKYDIIEKPLVSIIIPNKDGVSVLQNCLSSIIKKTMYDNYEIIIVDNISTEETTFKFYENLKKQSKIHIVNWKEKEFNYSKLNNFGVKHASGKHLLFLNNDVEIITPNWIEEMLIYSQRNDVGAVGMKLYFPDNTIQHAGIVLGVGEIAGYIFWNLPRDTVGYMARTHIVQNMSAVTADCMMVKRSVFEEVGCFSTEFYDSLNDIDLCLKIRRAGYLIVWTPYAEAYHHEEKQSDSLKESENEYAKEVTLFKTKWARELALGDPYYNCNFFLDETDYTIKNI